MDTNINKVCSYCLEDASDLYNCPDHGHGAFCTSVCLDAHMIEDHDMIKSKG